MSQKAVYTVETTDHYKYANGLAFEVDQSVTVVAANAVEAMERTTAYLNAEHESEKTSHEIVGRTFDSVVRGIELDVA